MRVPFGDMIGFELQRFTDLTCDRHLPVASNRVKTQITLQTGAFLSNVPLHF